MSNYSIRKFALTTGRFLKLIGLATFSLIDGKIQVTSYDFACLTFNILAGFMVFNLSLIYGIDRMSKYSLLLSLGVIVTMMSGSLVSLFSMISVFLNRFRLWKVVMLLDEVVEKFRKIHVQPNFTRYIGFFSMFALFTAFFNVFGLIIMAAFLGYSNKLFVLLIYGYLTMSFSAVMLWSSMFHLSIYFRVNLINITIRYFMIQN